MAAQTDGLGKTTVTTGGTPVLLSVPADVLKLIGFPAAHALLFQALSSNTGAVYIGKAGMDRTTLAHVLIKLPPPTTNQYPTFSMSITVAANAIALDDLYVDADVNGEGIMASILGV